MLQLTQAAIHIVCHLLLVNISNTSAKTTEKFSFVVFRQLLFHVNFFLFVFPATKNNSLLQFRAISITFQCIRCHEYFSTDTFDTFDRRDEHERVSNRSLPEIGKKMPGPKN